jgi:6,7-dimethyl-8-ribityllumazine synthase
MTALPVRAVDGKGRVSLGKGFANRLVLVKQVSDGVLQLTLAEAVPVSEAWLHKNKKALASVMRGLEQTGKGEYAESPALEMDNRMAGRIKG